MEGAKQKGGVVCVTGGTGYVASWLIMRLLQHGYSVRATVRSQPAAEGKKDLSFLTGLPGASERLQIFNADLDEPDSFTPAIEGCIGVFHVAHPIDFVGKEPEEVVNERAVKGTLGILKACLNSKTVRRVVYTSSAAAVLLVDKPEDVVLDESSWSDVDYIRSLHNFGASYCVSKTVTERAALEFAANHGLDLVTVIPTYIVGPFLSSWVPGSVHTSLAMVFGIPELYGMLINPSMVHIDDVASAHIFLFETPEAKGRYICSFDKITIQKMAEFLSAKYPEFPIPAADSLRDIKGISSKGISSKKLLDLGFKYKFGIEEMYDGAIQCCKEKGLL